VTVPVMLKFYVVSGLNLQVGPQFSFLVDGDQKFENPLESRKRDITDACKRAMFRFLWAADLIFVSV
jgi:hypothetical protein